MPQGVAVDTQGYLYVVDAGNSRIVKYNTATGAYVTQWNGSSSGCQLNKPYGIAVDNSGNVYVADSGNNRIVKFTNTGTYLTQWGSYGTNTNQFNGAASIAVDSSANVYVLDPGNLKVKEFTSNGKYITQWGSAGSGEGQLFFPMGIAVDASGNVYVSDITGYATVWAEPAPSRIIKFSNSGTYLTQWTGSRGELSAPWGLTVDNAGFVYASDFITSQVYKFNSTGTCITKWGSEGNKDGQLDHPAYVAVDAFGYAYVSDHLNSRIEKFVPAETMKATTANGTAVDVNITGTIDSSQMSNLKFTTNPTAKTTTLSFTVTGPSGGSGFGILTVPKSAVAYGTIPAVSIDGAKLQAQFYTQDNDNYYVWYTTGFSTHQITVEFTNATATESSLNTILITAFAALILTALAIGLIKKKKSPTKN